MTTAEAVELVQGGVLDEEDAPVGRVWADLGAGSGTFSFALARLLGPEGRVIAVDRERAALDSLRRRLADAAGGEEASGRDGAEIVPVNGDFREPERIRELTEVGVDGALLANALHFDPDPAGTLERIGALLPAEGRIVVVEYQDRPPNPWVPHPIPLARLEEVAATLGASQPRVVGERPSSYGGFLYCAWISADFD